MFFFALTFSCARTQTRSSSKTVNIKVPYQNSLIIHGGEIIELIEESSGGKVYKVHFEGVRGGALYLFAKIKIREKHGDDYKRLYVLRKNTNEVIKMLSLNDVLQLSVEKEDSLDVYVLE